RRLAPPTRASSPRERWCAPTGPPSVCGDDGARRICSVPAHRSRVPRAHRRSARCLGERPVGWRVPGDRRRRSVRARLGARPRHRRARRPHDGPVITPKALGRTLALAPDPELARVAMARIGERAPARELLMREDVLPAAVRLLGFSTAAADFFVAHPEELVCLTELVPRDARALRAELRRDTERLGLMDGLRRFRRRAMVRIAARDLLGAGLEEIVEEISAVAEICLSEACLRASGASLAVVALGKLGGAELNYASDVDVLFVHPEPGGAQQERAERQAAETIRLLSEPTSEGIALRVDPTLRPGGRGGPLSRSLDAMREYYASRAATWERQALIKARAVAGDADLGRAFVEMVAPFVYPRELPPAAIDEVRRVKVRLEEYVRARGKAEVEVKRGWGGIRDVEFAVQLLQIVHGRRDDRLRQPNTLR